MGQTFKPTIHPLFVPLLVSAALVLPMLLPEAWQNSLEYQRTRIADGEPWRLVTGHLVHLGWSHLGMNLLGFWLIHQLFFQHRSAAGEVLLGLLLLGLGASAGLYLFSPGITWYRGFSGVLHGLLVWALLREIRHHTLGNLLLLALLAAKLAWEQIGGPIPGSETIAKGRVIVDAHLYGGLSGVLLWPLRSGVVKLRSEVVE